MAWLFAVIGRKCCYQTQNCEFFVGNPVEGPGLGNLPRHHFSSACLAPEALSVRLGFLTKHFIVDLLMKGLFQKRFDDIYNIAV